jgi:small subunit ribosomal protein S17
MTMADATDTKGTAAETGARERAKGFRRRMVGKVTSNKMDKTVVVEVVRRTLDAKYKKYVRSRVRYKAHDDKNEYWVGDRVEIRENRPISKHKRWVVTRMIAPSADRATAAKEAGN